ncbi:MAG: outer membrane lipoprotein chaperone LolA [Cycloclasticus sp.]|nr:outer membrane lipoprotein chaperone LolA [Cycloclasticus sp.]
MGRCIILFLLAVTLSCFAENSDESLQTQLNSYEQMSGQFTQVISSERGAQTQSSTGEFWIKKPSKFRWHYSTPYIQKIISNGEKIWVYDEDLEQVTVKNSSQAIDSTPLAIILGSASIDKHFNTATLESEDDLDWMKLTPKNDSSGFDYIDIGLKNGLLSRMLLQDSFGQKTRLLFSHVEVSTAINDDNFDFEIPEGSDVFEETLE